MKRAWLFLCLFPILLFLSGCSPFVRGEQTGLGELIEVQPRHWIGQSFVAGYRGLSGIDVYIAPKKAGHRLTLLLYSDGFRKNQLASSTIQINGADDNGYFRFPFSMQKDSMNTGYYFDIQVEGNSAPAFSAVSGEKYLDGSLYLDQFPQDAQISFRLVYDPVQAIEGLLVEFFNWAWYWLLACFLYVVPGWGLLKLFLGENWSQRHWIEKFTLSSGIGLALYPVLMLWAKLAHLRLGGLYSWVPAGVALVYLLWKNRKELRIRLPKTFRFERDHGATDLIFVILFIAILFGRFWAIRSIDMPMWGDSYQHTMISQLMVNNGGLFDSWKPYVPYQSLTVQYGFSSGVAVWMWITGMQSPQATLIFGQLLNVFAILSLYPLALLISRGNRWAGNAAVLIGGLLSLMPAMYANWGRYAQLIGEIILPVALCLVWYWLENPRFHWKQLFIQALALGGLLLSYYRMAFYYAAFIPILLALFRIRGPFGRDWRCWKMGILKLAGIAVLSLAFIFPWLPNVSGSRLSNIVEAGVAAASPLANVIADYKYWLALRNYLSDGLLLLVAAGLVTSILMKHWEVSGVIVWLGLVSAVKAGSLIHLPGANLVQSFMVLISLYIFASLIGGWLIGFLVQRLQTRLPLVGTLFAMALFLGMTLYGLNSQRKIVNPLGFSVISNPDLRAMEWIRSQTPLNSVFLVEGFRIYSGTTAVGGDGGWWIPLLTLRQNTMPPQYALTNERPDPPDYTEKVVDLVAALEKHSPADPQVRQDLCRWGITHIYIGQQQGKIGSENVQLFPANLDPSGTFPLVYAQDRVRIYSVPNNYCQSQPLQ